MSGGKPSYSHVVTVSGSGKIVYTAGQLARDVDGNCVGKGDMRAQMEQTFQNLDRCLKAAGATWADVVKTNTFVTDFDEFHKCADIRMRYLGVATPTSTTVGVTRLAGPDFMIEIEAVAVVNSWRSGSGPTPVRRPGKRDPSTGQTGSVAAPIEYGSLKRRLFDRCCPAVAARGAAEAMTAATYRPAATATGCRGKRGQAAARSGAGQCYGG
jgi:enamine deaminase RidA (YjgF/YER057c/UK114 family)